MIYFQELSWFVVMVFKLQVMCDVGEKIVMFICYDVSFFVLFDCVGIDVLLIGDLFGNVLQGYMIMLLVLFDDIVYYIVCVVWVQLCVFVVVDLLFGMYGMLVEVFVNVVKLMCVGVQMVKFEGGEWFVDMICFFVECLVFVCVYFGFML